MKLNYLMAGLCLAAVPVASPAAAQSSQSVKYVTIDGEVLRYEPGRTIVIRGADNREVLYNLNSGLVVPADVRVGQRVTLYTEPGLHGGTQIVKRVTTTSMGSDGNVRRTTEDVRTLPSGQTTRTVVGDVIRYEPGRVIVVRGSDNREVSYNLHGDVTVPADVQVGRNVTLYTEPGRDGGTQMVKRVTFTTVGPDGQVRRTTEDVRTHPSGHTTRTVVGDVIRYEPGRVIVVRGSDDREVSYNLSGDVAVPADVSVGRRVTLYTEPGRDGGTQLVSRVTTTSITPEGNVQRTTEDTRTTPYGATTTTSTTTVTGRVDAYVPGKTLTVTRADGTQATYVITGTSNIPADLAPGKTISIIPVTTVNANGDLVIRTITYVKPR